MAGGKGFVAVFDSGLGGISVLRRLVDALPHEDFVYVGDSAHNPYGERSPSQILSLSRQIVGGLVREGAKAVVIACNTATSVAAATLRRELSTIPIVGVEPALKPATEHDPHRRILVMATPVTLRLDKYQQLAKAYGSYSEGLAKRIEQGRLDEADLREMISSLVGRYRGTVDSVVLGCTHYPFVARQIREVVGDVPFFDGANGVTHRLKSLLSKDHALAKDDAAGSVTLRSSLNDPKVLERYRRFLKMEL